jgi:hypothetical protein
MAPAAAAAGALIRALLHTPAADSRTTADNATWREQNVVKPCEASTGCEAQAIVYASIK